MVHGLVRAELLRFITRQKSHRTRNRHAPRVPRWILAASNQGVTCRASEQLTALLSVHRLWFPPSSGISGVIPVAVQECAIYPRRARTELPVRVRIRME